MIVENYGPKLYIIIRSRALLHSSMKLRTWLLGFVPVLGKWPAGLLAFQFIPKVFSGVDVQALCRPHVLVFVPVKYLRN